MMSSIGETSKEKILSNEIVWRYKGSVKKREKLLWFRGKQIITRIDEDQFEESHQPQREDEGIHCLDKGVHQ